MVSLRTEGVVQEGEGAGVPHITLADLQDTESLMRLYHRLVKRGHFHDSEAYRLDFVAAAERALRKASKNAPGFFAQMIRSWGRCRHHISMQDEERARTRLAQHLMRLMNEHPEFTDE